MLILYVDVGKKKRKEGKIAAEKKKQKKKLERSGEQNESVSLN